jgi:hypothetical protein
MQLVSSLRCGVLLDVTLSIKVNSLLQTADDEQNQTKTSGKFVLRHNKHSQNPNGIAQVQMRQGMYPCKNT